LQGADDSWLATLFAWIACFAQSAEFSTFAFSFYIPVLFVMVGVSGIWAPIRQRPPLEILVSSRADTRQARLSGTLEDAPWRQLTSVQDFSRLLMLRKPSRRLPPNNRAHGVGWGVKPPGLLRQYPGFEDSGEQGEIARHAV
jgi:hypothetical protein